MAIVPENYEYEQYQEMQPEPEPRRFTMPILEMAGLFMMLAAIVLLAREFGQFRRLPQTLPAGSEVDEIPVAGLTAADAQAQIRQRYAAPITVYYRDQALTLDPAQVDFSVQINQSLEAVADSATGFPKFWDYLWLRPDAPASAKTVPSYSADKIRTWLTEIARQYDLSAQAASTTVANPAAEGAQSGYSLDVEASVPLIEAALTSPTNRTATLVIRDQAAPERPAIALTELQEQVVNYLVQKQFRGVMSLYVIDESSGEELYMELDMTSGTPVYLDCTVAYAGLSTMKIPIVLNYYRYLEWEPLPYEYDVVEKTLIESSNLMPNVILNTVGFEDAKRGAFAVTDSMKYLGMENSFIATPYDEEDPPDYFSTPAREAARTGACVDTLPDPYMQTTAQDMAILLDMIYQCAAGRGDLIAAYSDEITPGECQAILDTMKRNAHGTIIRAGLPVDTPLAHKHGFTYDTISDSGVVFSPGGDYVITIFIWQDTDWVATGAYPIMMDVSALTFNYFNPSLANEPRQGFGDELEVQTDVQP